jgi:hypothetical protein
MNQEFLISRSLKSGKLTSAAEHAAMARQYTTSIGLSRLVA